MTVNPDKERMSFTVKDSFLPPRFTLLYFFFTTNQYNRPDKNNIKKY